MWHKIGTQTLGSVPAGNVLTIAPPITWQNATIPAEGHYCFVGIVGTVSDPEPDLVPLGNWDNFVSFIRGENNVTWKNFNVVDLISPLRGGQEVEVLDLPFLSPGALDRDLDMELEVLADLHDNAQLFIELPRDFTTALRNGNDNIVVDPDTGQGRIRLQPRGNSRLGRNRYQAKTRNPHRLLVRMPAKIDRDVFEIAVRQLYGDVEVGRVTWRLLPDAHSEVTRSNERLFTRLLYALARITGKGP